MFQLVRQHATHGSIKGTLDDTIDLRNWMRHLVFLSTGGKRFYSEIHGVKRTSPAPGDGSLRSMNNPLFASPGVTCTAEMRH